ncbi:MAG: Kelch repeat-containing protein [Actinomycetota bacterium]|jgi:hypothetical protein
MRIEEQLRDAIDKHVGQPQADETAWSNLQRRVESSDASPEVAHGVSHRLVAGIVAFAVFGGAVALLWVATSSNPVSPSVSSNPPATIPVGWTRLPLPPEDNHGTAEVWTGTQLLSWGGYRGSDNPVADGFALDPSTQTWTPIPPAPAARSGAVAVWTGSEAIFLGGWDGDHTQSDGFAFDPATSSWRAVAAAPVDIEGAVLVWTGSELIAWGGGKSGDKSNNSGAAYDPSTDTWRRIADAPIGLNLASGVWTGSEFIVFGSLVDSGNHASTQAAVGAAYDPTSDAWRKIAPSDLSPQADAAVWQGDRMVAYDYLWKAEAYTPSTDTWKPLRDVPFEPSECYPDGATVGTQVFAFGCGHVATLDAGSDTWHQVHGGIGGETIQANGGTYELWRFATLVPAGDVLFLSAEGITVRNGAPCYGCSGSPTSLWVYRPAE